MPWEVQFTDEFELWWNSLSEADQGRVDARVRLLMDRGPHLGFPFSSQIKSSQFAEMREHRSQIGGDPIRILHAFDPRRIAVLLLGGDKTGDERWYEVHVALADRLFAEHLESIQKEKN